MSPVFSGTIQWLNRRSGYGMIAVDTSGAVVGFHERDAHTDCVVGERVCFRLRMSASGPQAVAIESYTPPYPLSRAEVLWLSKRG